MNIKDKETKHRYSLNNLCTSREVLEITEIIYKFIPREKRFQLKN